MPAPPPQHPPPLPPPDAAPPFSDGASSVGLVAEEEQAIIDHCGLPPSTPETLERFDENFSGLTEEEKSPMPPKAARVRRLRRRATSRATARVRKRYPGAASWPWVYYVRVDGAFITAKQPAVLPQLRVYKSRLRLNVLRLG